MTKIPGLTFLNLNRLTFYIKIYLKLKICFRHEAEYAWKTLQPDDVIPVIVEQGYTPKQWLGKIFYSK